MAIHSNVTVLAVDCFAEFTAASEPGLAMTTAGDEGINRIPYNLLFRFVRLSGITYDRFETCS